ncbi:MAG: serine hydroxymethyltransferase [Alphaproteobacteria bacterium]
MTWKFHMNNFSDPTWNQLLAELHDCGTQLTSYERKVINLIASDNACPDDLVSNAPYAGYMIQEGVLGKRPFAGADLHDRIEGIAAAAACKVFDAEHANMQPHSCSQANQAVYHALLSNGDPVLALGFKAGGHLTHGLKLNFSGRAYNFTFYGTGHDGLIDYDRAAELATQTKPKLVICGSSAYPRLFDAQRLRKIADSVNARLMFDLSHEAGLIAGKVIPNPIPLADVATMSLDKTLRGPFGGTILCRQELATSIDKAVHPGTQSSFSVRKISDAANALILTQGSPFQDYARNVIINAKTLEHGFSHLPGAMLTGGTDKHYVVLDVQAAFGINGVDAEKRLEKIGILSNRQTLPTDASPRMADTSGLRLGTAWASSRGYCESDFKEIAQIICDVLASKGEKEMLLRCAGKVNSLALQTRKNDVWAPR